MTGEPGARSVIAQMVRYGIVGVLTNLAGYLLYLAVTWLWLEPKLAVTVLYPVGVAAAYFGHARYAFTYRGGARRGWLRYLIAHALGYGANVLTLCVFADAIGFPHQAVQAAAIPLVAGVLFLLFKYFVFAPASPEGRNPC
jgi:putative flippase GtrA